MGDWLICYFVWTWLMTTNFIPVTISGLPNASAMDGTELVPIVQAGVTSQTTAAAFPYLSPAADAVARTMFGKVGDWVSVKDFGAVGNGIADDTVAIGNAIVSMGVSPYGGTVFFPAGDYKVSQTISVVNNAVVLMGSGAGGSGSGTGFSGNAGTQIIYPADRGAFNFVTDQGGGVCNMTLRPTSAPSAGAAISFAGGISSTYNSYGFVDGVVFEGAYTAINMLPAGRGRISNCTFINSVSTAVILGNTVDQTVGGYRVEGCYFTNTNAQTHLLFKSLANAVVQGCHFAGGNNCVQLSPASPITVASGLTIAGCTFYNYTVAGINLSQPGAITISGFSITGNVFRNSKTGTPTSILLSLGIGNGRCVVTGNTFEHSNTGEICVDIVSGDSFSITGNVFRGNTSTLAVRVQASGSLAVIGDNLFSGWTTTISNLSSTVQNLIARNMSDLAIQTVASASPLVLPDEGEVFNISGTTSFSAISQRNQTGRRVTLIFAGILTVTNSGTLKVVGGTYTTSSADTLSLICDGTLWSETSRTVL